MQLGMLKHAMFKFCVKKNCGLPVQICTKIVFEFPKFKCNFGELGSWLHWVMVKGDLYIVMHYDEAAEWDSVPQWQLTTAGCLIFPTGPTSITSSRHVASLYKCKNSWASTSYHKLFAHKVSKSGLKKLHAENCILNHPRIQSSQFDVTTPLLCWGINISSHHAPV